MARSCCQPKQCPLLSSIFLSVILSTVIGLWVKIWHRNCSDSNRTAQLLQMAKVCSHINRKWNAIFESHIVTSVDRTSFNFQHEFFFEQSAFVNSHLLCYWPIILNLISKICHCLKFQVISSHFSRLMSCSVLTFSRLMSCLWRLTSMLNAINVLIKGMLSRILVFHVWPWYSTWTIWNWQSYLVLAIGMNQWPSG